MLGINRGLMSDPAAPFGGSEADGLGREGGVTGILEFMEPKYYAVEFLGSGNASMSTAHNGGNE